MSTQITTELDALWTTRSAVDRLVAGKAAMQNAYNVIAETNAEVQALVDEGAFAGIPADILAALNGAWTALKNCQTALEAANIREAITWAGK
jgi:hypothetical protein